MSEELNDFLIFVRTLFCGKNVIALWGPFQLMGFSIVTYYITRHVFVDDSKELGRLKYQAYQFLGISEGYFLMIMMRDIFASFIQLRSDHPMALWEAMTLHVVGLPIDSLVIFILSGYGWIVYQSIVRNECDGSIT